MRELLDLIEKYDGRLEIKKVRENAWQFKLFYVIMGRSVRTSLDLNDFGNEINSKDISDWMDQRIQIDIQAFKDDPELFDKLVPEEENAV